MSFTVLRALNPFATLSDVATSRRTARLGGGAGLVLAAFTAWGAVALHRDREAVLDATLSNIPDHPDPDVVAGAMSMAPMMLTVVFGLLLVTAAGLILAAVIQFRRGGRILLLVFAAVALWYLHGQVSGLLLTASTHENLGPYINLPVFLNFLFLVFVLTWIASAFRAAMHQRRSTAP